MGATPYTTIKLMRRYPCGPDYENSLYFANVVAQTNYMDTLVFKTFTNQSFQRPSRGRIRLQIAFTDSETVNYLAWNGKKNPNVASDVWYYAFVTGVKCINEAVTEFEYQIDIIQTYWWLVTVQRCFVERENTVSDAPYEHLIDEGISIGEYTNKKTYSLPSALTDLVLIIAASFNKNLEDASTGRINGLFNGLSYNLFDLTDTGIQAAIDFLSQVANQGKTDGIVSCFYAPRFGFTSFGGSFVRPAFSDAKFQNVTRSDGSSIRNNKLLSYPYTYLYVTNNAGDAETYKFELFDGDNIYFNFTCDTTCSPSVICIPASYNNGARYQTIGITGYPVCSYTNDSFKAWLAQNGANFIGSKISTFANGAAQIAGGLSAERVASYRQASIQNDLHGGYDYSAQIAAQEAGNMARVRTAAGAANVGGQVLSTFGTLYGASIAPNTAAGVGSSSTLYCAGLLNFTMIARSVHPKFIDSIDDYFDMFGYKVNVQKRPTFNNRPHWTYVKTQNCQLTGYVGNNVSSAFKNILNNGIRFWRNGAEVGQYNLDNRPVSAQVADGTMSVEEAQAYEA